MLASLIRAQGAIVLSQEDASMGSHARYLDIGFTIWKQPEDGPLDRPYQVKVYLLLSETAQKCYTGLGSVFTNARDVSVMGGVLR